MTKRLQPCSQCPFRTDITPFLRRDRAEEIAHQLVPGDPSRGGIFPCHKTVNHDHRSPGDERWCTGALIVMAHEGTLEKNQAYRIDQRLGIVDENELNMEAPVYDSLVAWITAQGISGYSEPSKPNGKKS